MLWVLIQQCHLVRFFFYCLLYDFMLCIYSAVALAQHATDEYESKLSVIVGYLHKSSLLYFNSLYTSIQRYLRLTKPWNSALHNVNGEILCFVICEIWARTRSERVKSFAMNFFFCFVTFLLFFYCCTKSIQTVFSICFVATCNHFQFTMTRFWKHKKRVKMKKNRKFYAWNSTEQSTIEWRGLSFLLFLFWFVFDVV
jgi:FlaA1/EpsC-like NDP-sugar epimerase